MIISALLSTALLISAQDKPITLERVFKLGERASYRVESNLQLETRGQGLNTFMPEEQGLNYDFSYEVTQMKPDGFAVVRYKRPTMTETRGEDFNSGPRSKVVKTNIDYQITISPINEITEIKDLAPKKKSGGKAGALAIGEGSGPEQINIGSFIGELYRLALFVDAIDSSIDFSPKLPFDEIKPGDTWQKTVGYSPQRLKGKEGKSAVQRLDYTYTYKGIVQSGGKKVYRINAALKLDTDAAEFVNQLLESTSAETHLKEIRLNLQASIDYDLDLKTRQTLKAVATSAGAIKIVVTDFPDEPVQEQRLKGLTTMTLVSKSGPPSPR